MRRVHTSGAPEPVGPYSQAIVHNGFVYTAGQVGIDPATGNLIENLEDQTHQAMRNLQAVLQAAGSNLHQLIKVTIYLRHLSDFNMVNEIYSGYLTEPYPARSTVEVARLPLDARVEIDAVAFQSDQD